MDATYDPRLHCAIESQLSYTPHNSAFCALDSYFEQHLLVLICHIEQITIGLFYHVRMSQPFRFLDLPAELQVVVLSFYFEAPFDIKINRRWIWEVEEESEKRLPTIEDSRSVFTVLWTSPKLYQQALLGYLQGFSGRLDVSNLKIDCGEPLELIYDSLFRTLPRIRIGEIDLGLGRPAYCSQRGVFQCDDEDCQDCMADVSRMLPHLFKRFENLRTVSISLGYDVDHHQKEAPVDATKVAKLLDGSLDFLFCPDMVRQLKEMDLLDRDGNPPTNNGRALALQVSIWDHIEYMPKGEGFPHEHATHKAEGYYYYVSSLTLLFPSSANHIVPVLEMPGL